MSLLDSHMEGDGSLFDAFVSKKASKDMDKLDAADILDPSRCIALEKFFSDLAEHGDTLEIDSIEKVWAMNIPLPTTLVIYAGFLRGVAVPVEDVELCAEKLGDGSVVLYEDGRIFGFNDKMEGKVYLPNVHEDLNAAFGALLGAGSSGSGRFRSMFRRIVSVLVRMSKEVEDSTITVGAAPEEASKEEEEKPSALKEVLFHMHKDLQIDMNLEKKREDIEFNVSLRKSFMDEGL